jgi:hypothetical protein
MKNHLFLAPILTLLDLQQQFKIENGASDYVIGVSLTQHGNSMAYHIKTLFDTLQVSRL